jgi:sterol desaturase/sphingolipid hydroxylase (fatty acid hydroxylase superfamily)
VTHLGKIALFLTLAIAGTSTAFVVHEIHIEGSRRLVQGAGAWVILALIASIGVVIFDLAYRWTRRALHEMQQPPR